MFKEASQMICEEDFKEISSTLDQLTPKIQKLASGVNQYIVMVGPTGTGKSTLYNALKDYKFVYQKFGSRYKIKLVKVLPQTAPIGNEAKSCTTIPGVYADKTQFFIDLAGFEDTRGPKQQIYNNVSNALLFTPGKKLKIILVISVAQFHSTRGGILINIIDRLIEFFQLDFALLINSIILVISKVNVEDQQIEHITQQLKQVCQLNGNSKATTRCLIETLLKSQRVCLFPRPDQIQKGNFVQTIKIKLKSIKYATLAHNGFVTLSPNAKKLIDNCINFLNQDLKIMSKSFAIQMEKQFKLKAYKNADQINVVLQKLVASLKIMESDLVKNNDFIYKSELLNAFTTHINMPKVMAEEMKKNFIMINFYSTLARSGKIQDTFLDIIKIKLGEVIYALQATRNQLVSAEQRVKMEKQFNEKLKDIEQKNKQQIQKAEQQRKKQQEQLKKTLQEQKKKYQQETKGRQKETKTIREELEQVKKKTEEQAPIVAQWYRLHPPQGCQIY